MRMLRSFAHAALGGVVLAGGLACAQAGDQPAAKPAGAPAAKPAVAAAQRAVADLKPTQGSTVQGKVTFTAEKGGVHVVADLTGLTPGEHGFHIHEKGDCSAPDGTSAGGHFNPGGKPHGAPDAAEHHAGDLGNIVADATGKAHLDAVFSFMTLAGPDSIVGHGFIVHAAADDLKTQPTGNAGARQACGVIQAQ
jgi:superoxide dismutase, Cu-Zn family